MNSHELELDMFPALGKRFAVKTDMQTLGILGNNMLQALSIAEMKNQCQWLFCHLLSVRQDVSKLQEQQRDEYLNDCIRLHMLRYLLHTIAIPIQHSLIAEHMMQEFERNKLFRNTSLKACN